MGDIPTPVNNTANAINNAIQIAILDVALNALRAYAIVQMPWLAWPVVNQIFNLVTGLIGKYFYTYLSQVATFSIIDFQTDIERAAYIKALDQLQVACASGDSSAINQATSSVRSSLANLIHFDGSASVQLKARIKLKGCIMKV